MTERVRTRVLPVVVLAMLLAPARGTAVAQRARCDRVATTSIAFGRTAGNIRPERLLLEVDGSLAQDSTGLHLIATIPVADVRRLARRGWTGPFVTLREAPTRPTRIPDAARDFVELYSACGAKHVEYVLGKGPRAFRELYDTLADLAGANAPSR